MSFTREPRYIVLKMKDIKEARLMVEELEWLAEICKAITIHRRSRGKQVLECVVVESDWPEYEPTWLAIEKRFTEEAQKEEER